MTQYDIFAFCRKNGTAAAVEHFKRIEEKKFPEHEFILRTPRQINQMFKDGLNEAKLKAGLKQNEIYVSDKLDGRPSVNLGATLLKLEVIFNVPLQNIPKLSRKWRKKDDWLPFEQMVKDEYDRCMKLYQKFILELDLALAARDLPSEELVKIITFIEREYRFALRKYSALVQNKGSPTNQRQATAEVVTLRVMLQRLKNINSEQA